MSNVIIDGTEYAPTSREGEELRIVILDNRGLTFIGLVDIRQQPGTVVTIRKARCIITWGTEEHIAELVNGPLDGTLLGAQADVEFLIDNLVISYAVQGDWYA